METKSVKERLEVTSAEEVVRAIRAQILETSRSVHRVIGTHPTFGYSPGRPSGEQINAIKAGGFDRISQILDKVSKLHG